jgi:predicted membrane channel-forming protein YqfA (hemolysin III family)
MLKSTISYIVGAILAIIGIILIVEMYKLKDENPHKKNLGYAGVSIFLLGFVIFVFIGFFYFARRNE